MYKYMIGLFLALPLVTGNAYANLILNGSFENTTTIGCDSNNSNTAFNSKMANVTAWGTASEIDIYNGSCIGPNAAIDGSVKLHLNNQSGGDVDAFNFDLSSSLLAGSAYDLSFYAASQSAYSQVLGIMEIGLSGNATSFGTQIFSASSTVIDTWELFSTTFIAGAGANFLSVQIGTVPPDAWIALDGFSLEQAQSVPEPTILTLLCLGLAGIGLMRRKAV